MKSYIWILAISVSLCSLPSADVLAGRGGGGGGGRGGGGGARMGGGGGARMGGGGGARPNFSSHAPSMSRAAPSINRSNFNPPKVSRPTASRPNVTRPNTSRPNVSRPDISRPNVTLPKPGGNGGLSGGGNRPNIGGGDRPGIGSGNRPNVGSGNRPNVGSGNRPNIGSGNRPSFGSGNRPNIGGATGPTFADKRPSIGQLDDFLGIPGGGNRPTTLPARVPGNRPGDIASKLPDRLPNRLPGNIGDRVGNIGDRNVNINAGNQVNIGNRVGNNNINSIRNKWSNDVNRPFGNGNYWDSGYSRNPNAWRWQHGWNRYPAHWCWGVGTWATVGTYFAWNWATPTPVVYDYGATVVYRDNYVYVQDQQVASADEYYEQASTIAQSVPENSDPEKIDWLPLGVFSISAQEATDTGMLIQLAVSKEGIIAGTFYNETTDSSRPLEGTVDRQSQRAAWKFADGKNQEVVMETVIHNLTEDESTALVHFGADKQENWTMVRMEQPQE